MQAVISSLNLRPNRFVAFAIHLTLSLLVFSTLVVMMLVYWFPGELFFMDGGWEGLKLVAMVDLVLGPALTLILFKPGKPKLWFDMSVIAALQIAALSYGFYTTYHERTLAVVFADNEFAAVSASDIEKAGETLSTLGVDPQPLPNSTAFQIPLYLTPAPADYGQYLADVLNGYPAAKERSDQYVAISGQDNADQNTPLSAQLDKMKTSQLSREDLGKAGALSTVEQALAGQQKTLDDVEVYRFSARYADGYALFSPDEAKIIDYVSFTPVEQATGQQAETTASADD